MALNEKQILEKVNSRFVVSEQKTKGTICLPLLHVCPIVMFLPLPPGELSICI